MLVTTPSYAPGVVALALSLDAVGSRYRVHALATSQATLDALHAEAGSAPPRLLDCELFSASLPAAAPGAPTHGGRGAVLAVDAPRRALFALEEPFVLLDADLIALQNPDALMDALACDGSSSHGAAPAPVLAAPAQLLAVPAFRLKRRAFGDAATGGFNAGVLVARAPTAADAAALDAAVAAARGDDTEETILNALFRGRWAPLPRGLNVPKRVAQHAPALWAELVHKREIVFLHFMGAKPWMADARARAAADWEADAPAYAALEEVWWAVRRGAAARDGDLLWLLEGGGQGGCR